MGEGSGGEELQKPICWERDQKTEVSNFWLGSRASFTQFEIFHAITHFSNLYFLNFMEKLCKT